MALYVYLLKCRLAFNNQFIKEIGFYHKFKCMFLPEYKKCSLKFLLFAYCLCLSNVLTFTLFIYVELVSLKSFLTCLMCFYFNCSRH